MAGQSQGTSKIGRLSIADFDDQLWPINCAILLLAGFAGALVVATSQFDDARLLYNAWARLATIGAIVGLMFWGTFRLRGKVRRRLQLSALVSLLIHLGIIVALYHQNLTLATLRDTSLSETRQRKEPIPLPEYEIRNPLPPEQNFERRVETPQAEQIPDRQETPQVARQETAPREIVAAKDTPVQAETAPSREASPVEIRRAEPSAPRRSEVAGGQLSRQDLKDRPLPEEPVPTPKIEANGAAAVAQVAPHVIPLPRQDREARLPNRQTFATLPSTQAYQEKVDLPRREAVERTAADASAAPLPARELAASEPTLPDEEAIPEVIAQGESRPAEPGPNASNVRRQVVQAAAPAAMNPSAEPVSQQAATARSATRRQTPGDRPQLAETSKALPSRATSNARLPSAEMIEQPVVASSTSPAATGTSPPEAAVARRDASAPVGTGPGQTAGLAAQAPLAVSPAQPRRSDRAGDVAFAASAASPGRLARTLHAADTAADSVEVDNPAIGSVAGAGQPSAEPAGINVGKASSGVAGLAGLGGTAGASRNSPGAGGDLPGSGGTSPLVSRMGQPREPSGGQPSGSLGVPTQRLAKTPAPGALLDSGTADVAGPPSLAGTGGGAAGNPTPSANAPATAMTREAGTGSLPAGRPDAGSGGEAGGGGTGLLAAARIGPAGPAEPMPGSQPSPGGGRLARSAIAGTPLPGTTVDEGGSAPAAKGSVAVDGPSGPSGGSEAGTAPAITGGPGGAGAAGAANPERASAGLPAGLLARAPADAAAGVGGPASAGSILSGGAGLPRAASTGDRNAMPAVAGGGTGAPLRRSSLPGEVSGSTEGDDVQLAGTAPVTGSRTDLAPLGPGEGLPSRRVGGLPVQIAAPAGPGGLDASPSPEVGLPSRKARPESEVVHPVGRRFVIERSGGELAIDALVREPAAPAFRQRDPAQREGVGKARGGTEGTERAVEMGIDFLARHQSANGSWSLNNFGGGRPEYANAGLGQMQSDTAATGLALLSFLGAGYTHLDDKHRLVVARGLDYLVRNQKPNGDLFSGGSQYVWFYSHGIAAIALCEAYGMTRDPQLREPAQKAIDFIVASQHPTLGGWRYDARAEWLDSDTSVSGWQLMALKSGEMAGLKVPPGAYTKVKGWLDFAQAPGGDPSRYVYNPRAPLTPDKKHGRAPSLAMTAEGLLMRLYLGWDHGNADLARGADYLKSNLPAVGTKANPTRDAYYWYYATQVMFQMGGEHWKAWNDALYPLLVNSQEQRGTLAGSWDPAGPVRDTWGDAGGRIYVTAMHILMLEVYYRHLPLFQTLANP
ncbi:MAG: prenyltransferase/squalene oxidase repeat-containing protein [Pirellulales bacterium]